MGRFLFQVQWDLKAAETEFRKALELDPRDEISLLDLPDLISVLYTKSPEELSFAKRAIDRDPTNSIVYFDLANVYFRAHRFPEAEQAARTAIQLSPHAEGLASLLASILMYRGDVQAALAELDREPGERWREGLRPQILDALGRKQEANASLAAFQEKYANTAPYAIAAVYARRGDPDHAFDWLERAYQHRDFFLGFVGVDLDFSKLKPDPRFRVLLRKLNLPG
jgi:serine/threonine-protein kinase